MLSEDKYFSEELLSHASLPSAHEQYYSEKIRIDASLPKDVLLEDYFSTLVLSTEKYKLKHSLLYSVIHIVFEGLR